MKTLAIDTSGKAAGIAVLSDDQILYEIYMNMGLNHSLVLLPELNKALETSKIELNDMDLFVTTTGPGSFTGLRIGLSTLKGFALSRNKPLVGVSTLEALAYNICAEDILICPILNGPLEEVYAALYQYRHLTGYESILKDQVTDVKKLVQHIDHPVIFVGDGTIRNEGIIREQLHELAVFAPQHFNICRPSVIAGIGIKKYHEHLADDMVSLIPTYLRASEAEIKKTGH